MRPTQIEPGSVGFDSGDIGQGARGRPHRRLASIHIRDGHLQLAVLLEDKRLERIVGPAAHERGHDVKGGGR